MIEASALGVIASIVSVFDLFPSGLDKKQFLCAEVVKIYRRCGVSTRRKLIFDLPIPSSFRSVTVRSPARTAWTTRTCTSSVDCARIGSWIRGGVVVVLVLLFSKINYGFFCLTIRWGSSLVHEYEVVVFLFWCCCCCFPKFYCYWTSRMSILS